MKILVASLICAVLLCGCQVTRGVALDGDIYAPVDPVDHLSHGVNFEIYLEHDF